MVIFIISFIILLFVIFITLYKFYNSAVTEYNNAVEMFPTNLIASGMKYQLKLQFQANSQARNNISLEINHE